MLRKLLSKVQEWMKPQSLPEATPEPKRPIPIEPNNSHRAIQEFFARHIQRNADQDIVKYSQEQAIGGRPTGMAMDAAITEDLLASHVAMDENLQTGMFGPSLGQLQNTVPNSLLYWFGYQTFIGYQMCSILAQHWLILKCCNIPARDAIRHGYEITSNDGTEIDGKVLDAISQADIRYRINHSMKQLITKGKIFGFRIALFIVDSDDPEYYEKPFNIDGVLPGTYKGIVQIDPYWITPELDFDAGANPSSIWFYEPTWWRVNANRIHRTHLHIFRNGEITDLLKPTYIYGGIPVPQLIYERVYCSERTASEAPQLAMTKRIGVIKVDASQFLANEGTATANINKFVEYMNNYGHKILDHADSYESHDTSLADFDAVIMSQYQLVAAAANIPSTKLLGTTPKGFQSTGEYDEASYHEELESIQETDLTPLLERHHQLLIRSEIAPMFGIAPFETRIKWNSLDARTAEEDALLNKTKAETDTILATVGAIDSLEIRKRVINDPESGYNGLEEIEAFGGQGGDPEQDPEANPLVPPELEQFTQSDPDPNAPLAELHEYAKQSPDPEASVKH